MSEFYCALLLHFRVGLYLPEIFYAHFETLYPPTDWLHLVVNFYGTEDEAGFDMYVNGVKTDDDLNTGPGGPIPGLGEVVVGRRYPSTDDLYSSVMVDELIFYNRKLCPEELQDIFLMYT